MIGNTPIIRDKVYKVVTDNSLAQGGHGYSMLKAVQQADTGYEDAESLRENFEKSGEVDPKVEGRLTLIG
jgi:2',3'-cyclic-nucleotide 2'-phosphodiesterase (5'-nucleotidase family)